MKSLSRIKPWMFKLEITVIYYAFRDLRTPFYAKIPAIISLIYLLSPLDLIPDFIPLIGYIDDLIIVPLLLNASIRLLPDDVRILSLEKARKKAVQLKRLLIGLIILIGLSLATIFFAFQNIPQKHNWILN
jgi:uncharacterized membrane protein YkvA (DUF1232 family)